jgi:pyruvate,water dikinase
MAADGKTRSFTLPSQLADLPGTEGWQSMYPYCTRFQAENDQRFCSYIAMHFPTCFDVDGLVSPSKG